MDRKGTKTEQNIVAAFQGESMARNRYTFFEEQARREGNEKVAEMFARMAHNETMHAKIWFKLMNDGLGTSQANIQKAANGENDEWRHMYPDFAKVAREEGFEDVARLFEQVAEIERDHEGTFLKAYIEMAREGSKQTQAAQPPEEAQPNKAQHNYRCIFCGALFESRPDVCSLCGAIGSFERLS